MLCRFVWICLLCASATQAPAFSLLQYNCKGNGVTDWSTNSTQVKAIGREVMYLQPDVITFNEIPQPYSYQMTNFVKAYLPGYFLATSANGDGYITTSIASRYPISRSSSWLHHIDLTPYGASGNSYTRDLFEAQITVPGFSQPVHVFNSHLKASTDTTSLLRRAAEAGAVSNFFYTGFLATNATHPYVLTGDLNEDINRPPSGSKQPIQRLVNSATGLQLTTPVNPYTSDDRTISIQSSLTARFDYILPCGSLFSNIANSQVFRTDLLPSPPPPLLAGDDKTASDHLPVLMVFNVDTIPPTITACASNRTLAAAVNCQALLPDLTSQIIASDASGAVTVTQNPPPGTALGLGVTSVIFTARDSSSNASSCVATVTVADLAPPMILSCATNLTLASTTNCQAALPDLTSTNYILALDNCSSVTVTQMPVPGTVLSLGTTNPVTLTAFDTAGNATNRAVLVVVPGVPNITLQPTNVSILVSSDATFIVAAFGPGQLYYQWQHADANLATATNPSLVLTGISANDAGGYAVVVSNAFGSTTSLVATLTVLQPPVITSQPRSLAATIGGSAAFSVSVSGLPPFQYQWRTNGEALVGQTNSILSIASVQQEDFAYYTVLVSNADGSVVSDVARLTPAASPIIGSPGLDSANFTLSFPTEAGPTYTVEYKFSLDETSWQVLTNVPGTGLPITITDNGLTNEMKFYRVRVQ
jgi:endonuclease/exonuclease/phosphatase family metal-dependent hydrolase